MGKWLFNAVVLWGAMPAAAAGPGPRPSKPVTVEDCVFAAVVNNLALARQRLVAAQAELEVDRQKEPFWPVLSFAGGYADERQPQGGAGPGTFDERTFSFDSGVALMTPLGTRLAASLANSRRHSTESGVLFEPEHSARLELSLDQPLLRGLGVAVNTADLEQARLDARVVQQQLRAQLNGLIRDVEWAYWELYFAQQDVEIKARSLERARRQYQDTLENIRRGLLPELDIHVVDESRVSFERKLADARNDLAAARTTLAGLMQLDAAAARRLVAAQEPDPAGLALPAEELQQRTALEDNPGLLAARARAEAARLILAVERDTRLPRLDLETSLALNGLTDDFGRSAEQLFSGDRREAFVGLRLELPLFRLIDDAGVVQARLELRRRLLALDEAEQALLLRLADLRRDILHGQHSYALARRISELARLKLEAEQQKYRAGVAALKDLVQFLRELDEAEIDQLRALVDLYKQVAELHAVVGDLHRLRGLEVR